MRITQVNDKPNKSTVINKIRIFMDINSPVYLSPNSIMPLSEPPMVEVSTSDGKIKDLAYRQFIESKIVQFFEDNHRFQIDNSLPHQVRIQACQETIDKLSKVLDVIAVIFPIRFREMIYREGGYREGVGLTKFCLVHQNLPLNIQEEIKNKYEVLENLMKGVEGTCSVVFGSDKFYRFNFLSAMEKGMKYTVIKIEGDSSLNPIIWDIPSDQITTLQAQTLNQHSILTKYGNRPLVFSTLNAPVIRKDYLDKSLNRLFIPSYEVFKNSGIG
jgi:hypothetical protein